MFNTQEELKPCPFCGCAMWWNSNRDWHHLYGGHDENCVFDADDYVFMVPATDEAKAYSTAIWNKRCV